MEYFLFTTRRVHKKVSVFRHVPKVLVAALDLLSQQFVRGCVPFVGQRTLHFGRCSCLLDNYTAVVSCFLNQEKIVVYGICSICSICYYTFRYIVHSITYRPLDEALFFKRLWWFSVFRWFESKVKSGHLPHEWHQNFKNRFRNSGDN